MLRELRLNNLAIIKNLDLEFNGGLISLTGETGAGKSIILDGISLLIGERSNLEMIRTGEDSLFAEGVFDLSEVQKEKLNKLGFEIEDDELIISRHFYRNSKSKITVNGMRMTVSKLKELMGNILDLVGQHEHQYLLNKNYHLGLLDRFLNKNGQELVKEIRNNVLDLKKINKKIGILIGVGTAITMGTIMSALIKKKTKNLSKFEEDEFGLDFGDIGDEFLDYESKTEEEFRDLLVKGMNSFLKEIISMSKTLNSVKNDIETIGDTKALIEELRSCEEEIISL